MTIDEMIEGKYKFSPNGTITSLNYNAGKVAGVSSGNICRVISGKRKTAGGFIWTSTQ